MMVILLSEISKMSEMETIISGLCSSNAPDAVQVQPALVLGQRFLVLCICMYVYSISTKSKSILLSRIEIISKYV